MFLGIWEWKCADTPPTFAEWFNIMVIEVILVGRRMIDTNKHDFPQVVANVSFVSCL